MTEIISSGTAVCRTSALSRLDLDCAHSASGHRPKTACYLPVLEIYSLRFPRSFWFRFRSFEKGVMVMFIASAHTTRLSAVSLLILLSALSARAQFGSSGIDDDRSSGMRQGTNTVIGQVVFPPGRQPDRRCTVRLSSVRVGEFSTMTDENGGFTFRRLRE